MNNTDINEFIQLREFPVIDARSEKEFNQGHIPGAINIPLLDNSAREQVGICYKQVGKDPAIKLAFELAGPKFPRFAKQAEALGSKTIRIHCWRGGMRSKTMAEIIVGAGINTVVLENGYKSFRHWVLDKLEERWNYLVLGGKTGSGKTGIISELTALGEQVIDLEDLANHSGSVYGNINKGVQPTNEQVENEIAFLLDQYNNTSGIWIENESRTIGKVKIPDPVYDQLRAAPVIDISCSNDERIQRIKTEYAKLPLNKLILSTEKLEQRLGNQRMNQAIAFLENGHFEDWIKHMLVYYDKCYGYGNSKRDPEDIHFIELNNNGPLENAKLLIGIKKEIVWKQQPTMLS